MNIVKITSPDINNGNDIRVTCWISGCTHKCPQCHNSWLQDYTKGKSLDKMKSELFNKLSLSYIDGITFSGGDPLCQNKESLTELLVLIKEIKIKFPTKNIWLYTGYTLKDLISDELKYSIISECDYIVDGKFVTELKDVQLAFRGSSNQHIWHVEGKNFEIVDDKIFKS